MSSQVPSFLQQATGGGGQSTVSHEVRKSCDLPPAARHCVHVTSRQESSTQQATRMGAQSVVAQTLCKAPGRPPTAAQFSGSRWAHWASGKQHADETELHENVSQLDPCRCGRPRIVMQTSD